MKKYIVLTTINSPTEATIKFSNMEDWNLIVVGDTKTPIEEYKKINCHFLSAEEQDKKYKKLSDYIGWKSIQRRNLGFIEAWKLGADVVATVDDDNIPYDSWGKDIVVGKQINIPTYYPKNNVFDPLSVTNHSNIWHRGYPLQSIPTKNDFDFVKNENIVPLVQANLWDGDPDVDAIYRISYKPEIKFNNTGFYTSNKVSPFNSQNTILHRQTLPYYSVIPFIGRMDDIWGAYFMQQQFPNSVVFGDPTVYQARNEQDLSKNLKDEITGYSLTMKLIEHLFYGGPTSSEFEKCKEILELYRSYYT